jgi:AraC family transcriptional regulator of adaptative response / DNA-3-methyladenine glycosylase II
MEMTVDPANKKPKDREGHDRLACPTDPSQKSDTIETRALLRANTARTKKGRSEANGLSNGLSEESRRAYYAAFKACDSRLDGRVFMGVLSTGIYCRPVCTARMPRYENCTFFSSAAAAEAAGYRPCLICRPETAPGMARVDATRSLAKRAAVLLRERCADGDDMETLAAKLGYTDRQLRRAFANEYGVTPVQYVQTCRLLLAKQLLTETSLSVGDVALAAGFRSVRRFNELFRQRYRLTPSDLRRRARLQENRPDADPVSIRLRYRQPYRFEGLLAFFRDRAIEGVEKVDERSYARTVRIEMPKGRFATGWLRVENDARCSALAVTISDSLLCAMPRILERVRAMFDLDCDPAPIAETLSSLEKAAPGVCVRGTRVPGCFDSFETASRAILGQQVSVKAANRLAARIVAAYGAPVSTGIKGLDRAFPSPTDVCSLGSVEDAFGELGVIRSRSHAIRALAEEIRTGRIDLSCDALVSEQRERLLALKGFGTWTADYIAMRTMGDPDVFLGGDASVKRALPDLSASQREELAEAWRPWRSYATVCLWNAESQHREQTAPQAQTVRHSQATSRPEPQAQQSNPKPTFSNKGERQ